MQDFAALSEFRYHLRRFLRFSEHVARANGLSPQQHQLMLLLKRQLQNTPPRISEIAERLQLKHHSTVELIDRLAAAGYVRRHRGRADRREVLLTLSPKGERMLPELSLHHMAELRRQGPALIAALERVVKQ